MSDPAQNQQALPPKRLEAGRSTLFAGHSLAASRGARPLTTFGVGESPLLARLRQFIPQLKAANEQTAPTTTIEEVVDGDSDGGGSSSAGSASPTGGGGGGDGQGTAPPRAGAGAAASGGGAAGSGVGVQMEVVLVPEGASDPAAKEMVDALADDGDDDVSDGGSGGGAGGAGRAEEPLPVVGLDIETAAAGTGSKPIHPGIRVVASGGGGDGGGGGGGSVAAVAASPSSSSSSGGADGISARKAAAGTSAPQTRKAGAISASTAASTDDYAPQKRARGTL